MLKDRGVNDLLIPTIEEFDLTGQANVARLYKTLQPQVVFHLAAEVGGIMANQDHSGRFFYSNMVMGLNMIEEGRKAGVEKFIQVGTICAYPKYTPVPFRERDLWNGYPEETNAPYGIAKKALLVMIEGYRREYGFNGVFVLPVNLYGPGDNFHPHTSHVIPALIRKMLDARDNFVPSVEIWGTGKASREFLFVDDCAEALVLAAERLEDSDPVNIGTGHEITIAELAALIARITGFKGTFRFNPIYPDGQPRRCLDMSRAEEKLGFRARVSLEEGLKRTIDWYEQAMKKGGIREVEYR
jgi:GDP-L-fucose synthase